MNKQKVSQIEFHITHDELDDFILRAAELIKEGYSIEKIKTDPVEISINHYPEPPIHILLTRRG